MEKLTILTYPNEHLRVKCKPIKKVTENRKNKIRQMLRLMHSNGGIGLAAPQVGWDVRAFVIGLRTEDDIMHEFVFINPEIINKSEETIIMPEGCLSIPGTYVDIERPEQIIIIAKDLDGSMFEMEADGILARCIQHENDHLSGVLIIDRSSS